MREENEEVTEEIRKCKNKIFHESSCLVLHEGSECNWGEHICQVCDKKRYEEVYDEVKHIKRSYDEELEKKENGK